MVAVDDKITNHFGIPDKYLDMFKAGIATINAGNYFEETLREQVGKIRLQKKAIVLANGQVQHIDVAQKLKQHGEKAIEYVKKFNNVVNQTLINNKGQDDIDCMAFELGSLYSEIAYLSITDQEKVKEFVETLKRK